jgi:hypothetical protein
MHKDTHYPVDVPDGESGEWRIRTVKLDRDGIMMSNLRVRILTTKGREMAYQFQSFYIPDRMMGGIERWVNHGILPGDFLLAVIKNDLTEACRHADEENLQNLPAFVDYLYNKVPAGCWGSPKAVADWANKNAEAREPLPYG